MTTSLFNINKNKIYIEHLKPTNKILGTFMRASFLKSLIKLILEK